MFQKDALDKLRIEMEKAGVLACILTGGDPHNSEYPPEYWKIREAYSGFSGSAGCLVVLKDKAALWTDSRYWLQARTEMKESGTILMKSGIPETDEPEEWLCRELASGSKVAADGRTISVNQGRQWRELLNRNGITLDFSIDLVEKSLVSRKSLPVRPVEIFDEVIAGESRHSKIGRIRDFLNNAGNDAIVISALDAVAWVLNLRGSDVPYNPVFTSYLFISQNIVSLFVDENKISDDLRKILSDENIQVFPYEEISQFLSTLEAETKLQIDPVWTSISLVESLSDNLEIDYLSDPVMLMKACKNPVEIKGIRKSMELDAVALTRFFIWLEENLETGEISEDEGVRRLGEFRAENKEYRQDSFACIAASGPNGAMNHYDPVKTPGCPIFKDSLFLLDSGGQYSCGTTDITRTIHPGEPTPQQKRDYTLVLKGHLALGAACFPEGTRGYQLDILARYPLWQAGLNYGHGTGHGVGFTLNVHEGPVRISPHPVDVPLLPGMVISNEPGLYREGEYGIRIENLIAVTSSSCEGFYEWENLTLFPYEKKLIDFDLLTAEELDLIFEYHRLVRKRVSPYLDKKECKWLEEKAFIAL